MSTICCIKSITMILFSRIFKYKDINMIGKTLKELRESRKLNQKELAKILGLKHQTISAYESDSREPDFQMLNKIADFFSVTIDYLFGRELTFYPENINLIKGNMSYKQLSKDIANKLNNPLYEEIFNENYLKDLAENEIIPRPERLLSLAKYAEVDVNFFYKNNNELTYTQAKKDHEENHDNQNNLNNYKCSCLHLDEKLKEFISDPNNSKYIKYAKKLKDQGINPDLIINFTLSVNNDD